MSKSTFYITTPIYYANSVPHIGNAYTTIAADVLSRYKRAMGYDVMFLTGMDEHGQKVQSAAAEKGVSPQQYVDEMAQVWMRLLSEFDIKNDEFIRTSEPRHEKGVLEFLKRMMAHGDVYEGEYEGWYCKFEENFLTDLQVQDGKCPDCGRAVERFRERAFFFALSRYEKRLLDHYDAHPDFIRPDFRMNEARRFVEQGLKDLCISRSGLSWGIGIPEAEDYTVYVWIDALINYLTGIGFAADDDSFARYWPCDLHLLGKDILKFHCIYWPAMLMSAELPVPKSLYNHGHLLVSGQKMSKSMGNVVDPFYLASEFGPDAVRYFLMRDIQFGQDGNFSEDNLVRRYNSDLANDLSNLIHRSLSMCKKFFDGQIPSGGAGSDAGSGAGSDGALPEKCASTFRAYCEAMDDLDFRGALESVWGLISSANVFIDREAPWALYKQGEVEKLGAVLYNALETGRIILHILQPFVPSAASKMLSQFGLPARPADELHQQTRWGGLLAGSRIQDVSPVFVKRELPKPELSYSVQARNAASYNSEKRNEPMDEAMITIDDFAKVRLVVGEIKSAEAVSGSKKLLKLFVDIGDEIRTAVAGMREFYEPDEMVGKKVIFAANLVPAKIFGIESHGMVLAAESKGIVSLLTIDKDVPVGSGIR